MDVSFAPYTKLCTVEELLPRRNGYVIVDESHTTGIYGPQGRGMVAALGLEGHVEACASFFSLQSLHDILNIDAAATLTTELMQGYLLNYARPLIYTMTLMYANIIAVKCAFDMLEK
ncbi:hypothetical protein BDR05DRAFT_1016473, partial [Suillus weaverae]